MDLTQSYTAVLPDTVRERYELAETRNAAAILRATNEAAFAHLLQVLEEFQLLSLDLTERGGQESALAARLNAAFRARGWREAGVDTRIALDLRLMPFAAAGESTPRVHTTAVSNMGYKVDNMLDRVALDVEWNAKDGNLDRDLAAYRALYDAGLIDCAVLITRTTDDLRRLATAVRLEAGMDEAEARKMLGTSTTTNLPKLLPRLQRGDAGGCPTLAIAISARTWGGKDAQPVAGHAHLPDGVGKPQLWQEDDLFGGIDLLG